MDEKESKETITRLRENAALTISQLGPLSGLDFGLGRASVAWIEGFIERQRARLGPEAEPPEGLVDTLGSFLGEAILAATPGSWDWCENSGHWSLLFPSKARAYPFAKVWKLFKNGLEGGDSIVSFYDVTISVVAPGKLSAGR